MRSEKDIMKKIGYITERKNYWKNRLDVIAETGQDSTTAYHTYRYWAAQEAALKYVVGLQDSLTVQN